MKDKKRFFIGGLILTMILAMAVTFAGCGGGGDTKTLEDYVNSDSEAMDQIDALQQDGMEVNIKGNTVTYTYTFPDTYEGSNVDLMKSSLEGAMKEAGSEFTKVSDTLEEESGVKEVTIKVVYLNGDGSELYSSEYK